MGTKKFKKLLEIPPGVGICHQINNGVFGNKVVWYDKKNNTIYPDSVVLQTVIQQ